MPLSNKDIRKLQPPMPLSVRRRESSSPLVTTTDSKTSTQEQGLRSMTSRSSLHHKKSRKALASSDENGYGSTGPSSPIVYWSEFETPEEPEPYTVPVDEHTGLLSWMRNRKPHDIEQGQINREPASFPILISKIRGILESQVKHSKEGLTTLFYEKGIGERDYEDEEEYNSEDSSDAIISEPPSHRNSITTIQNPSQHVKLSRLQLLNRGYALCVFGCLFILCTFGVIGLLLSGSPIGITFLLLGFLISISLEIVSLVRFVMYFLLYRKLMEGKEDNLALRGLDYYL
jgi:hypothetical protein